MGWRIIHKATGKQITVNDTSTGIYQSRAAVIRACKVSRVLPDLGLTWADIDLCDHLGQTMEARANVDVVPGKYALRHKEGWYWMHPGSRKIWYSAPRAIDNAWPEIERWMAQIERRKVFRGPGQLGFQLVQGLEDGSVKVYPHRY